MLTVNLFVDRRTDWNSWVSKLPRNVSKILIALSFRPYLVGVLTPDSTVGQWRIVFWIAFVIFNVTNIVYIIWASGEVQPWNDGALIQKPIENGSSSEDSFDESPAKKIPELKRDSLK